MTTNLEILTCTPGPRLKTAALPETLLVISSALVTVCTLIWLLWYCRYGMDFTDEGYFLNDISNPFIYPVSRGVQFGFVYHPLYELLNGNIVALRQANILIIFGLAWVLTGTFFKTILAFRPLPGWHGTVIAAGFAVLALVYFNHYLWLPTPSYNSLALQSLMIAATGLLLMERNGPRENLTGCMLLGIGGWLAFMAKPTTAIALGCCSVFYLFTVGKLTARLLFMPMAVAAISFVVGALLTDGSVVGCIKRLKEGVETWQLLESGHSLADVLRYDELSFGGYGPAVLMAAVAVFFLGALLLGSRIRVVVYCGTMLSMLFSFFSLAIILGFLHVDLARALGVGARQGLLLWAIPLTAALIGLSARKFNGALEIPREQWARAFIFLALSVTYTLGTNNNYWVQTIGAGIFWVLAGLFIVVPAMNHERFKYMVLSLVLAGQMMTVVLVDYAIEHPYRQPQPLRENNYPVDVGRAGSTLILAGNSGRYVSEAIDLGERGSFSHGTPMIDLTGRSPGVLYAMGAKSIGLPWLPGQYPGSDELVTDVLKRVACEELAVAWLLMAPGDPRRLSAEILSSFGADPGSDYKVVGVLETVESPTENGGAGVGYPRYTQQLLKPIRSAETMTAACIAARRGSHTFHPQSRLDAGTEPSAPVRAVPARLLVADEGTGAIDATGVERIIRSQWDVYLHGNRLIYVNRSCRWEDASRTRFPLSVYSLDSESGTPALDTLGFEWPQASLQSGTCVIEQQLPDKDIFAIQTGQVDRDGNLLWEAEYWFEENRQLFDGYGSSPTSGEPAARDVFDIYLGGGSLVAVKDSCGREDTEPGFSVQLHLTPADVEDLPHSRQRHGYDSLHIPFQWNGLRSGGKCMVIRALPEYDITQIRVARVEGDSVLWGKTFSVVRLLVADEGTGAMDATGVERIIRSQWDVYLRGNRLIYGNRSCRWEDAYKTRFPLSVYSLDSESGTPALDTLGFEWPQASLQNGTCVIERQLPDKDIFAIQTGQVDRDGNLLWEAEYWFEENRRLFDGYGSSPTSGEPAARDVFDIYLGGGSLVAVKDPCGREDISMQLHLTPADVEDLPHSRQRHGYDSLHIPFQWHGLRSGGKCMVIRALPEYDITQIRVARVEGDSVLWGETFSVP